MSKPLLHVEGFVIMLLSIYFYSQTNASWWLFLLLLFLPDVSMFGYTKGPRIGAYTYNIFHTYSFPLVVVLVSLIFNYSLLLPVGLTWIAHIGMDRMIGYGLKSTKDFKITHLQKV